MAADALNILGAFAVGGPAGAGAMAAAIGKRTASKGVQKAVGETAKEQVKAALKQVPKGRKPLLGKNPKFDGSRVNTTLDADRATAKSIFRNQTKGQRFKQKELKKGGAHRRTIDDSAGIRYHKDGSTRIDLKDRGPRPNGETIHFEVGS